MLTLRTLIRVTITVKPLYLATFGSGHNYGESEGGDLTGVVPE